VVSLPEHVVERLYAAPPDGFVKARAAAAAEARAAGDERTAGEIGKLRKPTVAAWLVNLLALRRPDLIEELAQLSAALRAAQRELRGAELRELSAQRREAVSALVEEARALAIREQPALAGAKLPLAEVGATLTAALADEEVAAIVRTGRLVRPVEYAGFGEVPRPQLRLVTENGMAEDRGAGPATARRGGSAADAAQRAAIKREMAAARTAQKEAEAVLQRAAAAETDGARALAEVEAELAVVERRRAAAEEELSRRKLAHKAAQRDAVAARRRAGEAEAAVEALSDRGGHGAQFGS
jgi:DNA repair exonuclease SbcCD ATPase subunit